MPPSLAEMLLHPHPIRCLSACETGQGDPAPHSQAGKWGAAGGLHTGAWKCQEDTPSQRSPQAEGESGAKARRPGEGAQGFAGGEQNVSGWKEAESQGELAPKTLRQ